MTTTPPPPATVRQPPQPEELRQGDWFDLGGPDPYHRGKHVWYGPARYLVTVWGDGNEMRIRPNAQSAELVGVARWNDWAAVAAEIVKYQGRIARYRAIVELPLRAEHDGLIVVSHHWDTAASARLNELLARDPDAGHDAVRQALGVPASVGLSSDGRTIATDRWCACDLEPGADWTRYERWGLAGRLAHGFICPDCRHLVQSG